MRGLLAEMTGFAPVLLLDEVVAHLDPGRRAALYDALARLGAQVWMTGADPAAFADIAGARADCSTVDVRAGRARALNASLAREFSPHGRDTELCRLQELHAPQRSA